MTYKVQSVTKQNKCENPRVTVIVPVYKVDKYLVTCLNSIVNQTMKELEIIIVDEGDKDRCREIIDYFESVDPRIKAPHKKNGGYGASCNLGIEMARGEYLAIVESDDFIEPEMYEEMYAYAKALDADVVKAPFYEYFSGKERRDYCDREFMSERTPKNHVFSMKQFGEMLQIHACLWSGIYKTSYMRKHNIKFVEAKGAAYVDVGFRIKTLINTERVAWLDKPFYNYRMDSENSSTNNFKLMPMLERWHEVHEYFLSRQDDYDQHYGKYLIVDEYLNTLSWAYKIKLTHEEEKMLIENLSYVKEVVINSAPFLDKEKRISLLEFKKNSKIVLEKLKEKNEIRDKTKLLMKMIDDRFVFPYMDVKPGSKIVIYGGGIVGKTFLGQLGVTKYCQILAVCDRNPTDTGIENIPVISMDELSKREGNSYDAIVIAIENREIAEQIKIDLENIGIPKYKIKWINPLF